jgi:hypothetical protein
MLWIVPAKVEGTWSMPQGDLKLTQQFQVVSGTMGTQPIAEGRLRGDELTYKVGSVRYKGTVNGRTIVGNGPSGNWTATRQ